MEVTKTKLPKHTEFETKYRVDGKDVYEFKKLVEALEDDYRFTYAQGPDYYFTKSDGSFMRYRRADTEKRAEITMKEKVEGAKHNVNRKEVNWKVDYNLSYHDIYEGAMMQQYDFNFKISKMCHIYKFQDVTLVYYTVIDDNEKIDHFVEIELDEKTIHLFTEDEAMNRIRKYEKILEPLGITHKNRLRKSLYEMYVKDIYNKTEEKTESVV